MGGSAPKPPLRILLRLFSHCRTTFLTGRSGGKLSCQHRGFTVARTAAREKNVFILYSLCILSSPKLKRLGVAKRDILSMWHSYGMRYCSGSLQEWQILCSLTSCHRHKVKNLAAAATRIIIEFSSRKALPTHQLYGIIYIESHTMF